MSKKAPYKRPRQIALYVDNRLLANIASEGVERRRTLGPTCIDILEEYFKRKREPIHATR